MEYPLDSKQVSASGGVARAARDVSTECAVVSLACSSGLSWTEKLIFGHSVRRVCCNDEALHLLVFPYNLIRRFVLRTATFLPTEAAARRRQDPDEQEYNP